jgi:hypothetical protein
MAILQTGLANAAAAGGYQIARSLRFNSADSAYLNRTPGTASNRKTWTWSGWVKRSKLGTVQQIFGCSISGSATNVFFDSSDRLWLYGSLSASVVLSLVSTSVYRDTSAWYHVSVLLDTTQATAANRARMWINGVELTVFTTATYPTQNTDLIVNTANPHNIGRDPFSGANLCDFYLTETYFIDGQGLTASSFGESDTNTGVWIPKQVTGMTYGTNGYYINFSDNSGITATTLGKDSSGNSNNYTPNNFSVTAGAGNDSLVDSPTNYGTDSGAGGEVRGNYATLNPLAGLATGTFSNGNLDFVGVSAGNSLRHSTVGFDSGKWYAEVTINSALSAASNLGIALYGSNAIATTNGTPSRGYYYDGQKFSNGTLSAYGSSFTSGDVIGIAVDIDNSKVWFSKNGTWQNSGSPTGGTNAAFTDITGTTWFPSIQTGGATAGSSCTWNFGQRPFAYTAPSGFKALCTTNLTTPAVVKPNTNFDVALYTGTGSSLSVSSLGFQPDFTWIKGRSGATNHALYDAVRGVQKDLVSNATSAETTETQGLTAFGSTGFTVGTLAKLNTNTATYASWNWKANGTGVSNTAGSITSTVSANTAAGISVVTYTAQTSGSGTIGHGLGVAPVMILNKPRTGTIDWTVYHISMGNAAYLRLNTTAAAVTGSAIVWNSTSPTSTVFSQGSAFANLGTMVAYCFSEVAGFSKFGSYTGNGSADGPFVYCGFRPRWIMIKKSSAIDSWQILDTSRSNYNVSKALLQANSAGAENSTYSITDILSNGFKIRDTDTSWNLNGATFIFAAFADAPFNYARAR